MDNSLGQNIEFTNLKDVLAYIKEKISEAIAERDGLKLHYGPYLENLYLKEIGNFQLDLFYLEAEVNRIRLKIDMIQSALNRNEPFDVLMIEEKLNETMKDWEVQISNYLKKIQEAHDSIFTPMAPEEGAYLHSLYKKLVRLLHPDLNPDLPEKHKSLWHQVQQAFKNSDINELKIIEVLLSDPDEVKSEIPEADLIEQMKNQIEYQTKLLNEIRNKTEFMKSQYPFTLEEKLKDKETLIKERDSIKTKKEILLLHKQQLEQYLSNLMLFDLHGKFSLN